ncbi:MAG: Menaquinone-specific isochorismate synthase [Polyangiaceae bacterium]|jgi:menaquinone-specific isochorismate synthase|nr:Menaquinone-specific isochorismate synthase [Polyangiaceae bacterium]
MTQRDSASFPVPWLERESFVNAQPLQWLSVPAPLVPAESLLAVAPRVDAWYWSSGGDHELVGLGVARRLFGSGSERFQQLDHQLQQLWSSLEPAAALEAGAPAPRVVGGLAFQTRRAEHAPWSDFGEGQLLLPRVTYARREGRAWLTLVAAPHELGNAAERARLLDEALQLVGSASRLPEPEAPGPYELAERDAQEWREQIRRVKAAISAGGVQKVVLARRVLARFARELSPARALTRLRETGPMAPRFAFRVGDATFLGSPPERVLVKRGSRLETEAVAGTLPASDPGAVEQLTRDAKLLAEHAPVVQDLLERLRPLAELDPLPEHPIPYRARNVWHLKTPISATLREPHSALSLLSRIHPTPAVGGYPTRPALDFIAQHEPDERGWYAGPIGWIDAAGDAEFAVALRSGVITGKLAHLYVGAGIVSGSDSDSELAETSWKLKVLLSALG